MLQRFKMDYLKQINCRHQKSNNRDKTKILDEFCMVCNYIRTYAIRKLEDSCRGLKNDKITNIFQIFHE